jgi:hypothetical protein
VDDIRAAFPELDDFGLDREAADGFEEARVDAHA